MEILPPLGKLKASADDGHFEHVVYFNSDTIDFVDEDVGGDKADVEAQLAEQFALEVYREEVRCAEQLVLDKAVAFSIYTDEEHKLLHPADANSEEDDSLVLVNGSDVLDESKPPPSCTCCMMALFDEGVRRILPCGHLYCTKCIATRCRMGVRDRSMVPAHCCKREFPSDYVREALRACEFPIYERFLKDKPWRTLDLQSDREYTLVVQQHQGVQCPGCGVGVQKSAGCNRMNCLNGHEFCFLCAEKWKTCNCSYY